jgi:Xaa-Pro aminopeptidase
LDTARIGIDDPELVGTLRLRRVGGEIRAAENVLRRARLAKSATDIQLTRLAAQQNVNAALVAARSVRSRQRRVVSHRSPAAVAPQPTRA